MGNNAPPAMPSEPSTANGAPPAALPEPDPRRHDWGDLGTPGLDDDRLPRFPFASFHCPTPVAFPRAPFDEALRHHEALARAHLPAIEFVARRWAHCHDPLGSMEGWCVEMILDRGAEAPRVDCYPRGAYARRYRSYFGLARRLVMHPGRDRMYLVAKASSTFSVSLLAARRETGSGGHVRSELVLEQPAVAFEPVLQCSVRSGGEWLVGWRVTEDGPTQMSRTAAERKASSPAEFLDHLFAAHHDEVRALAWANRAPASGLRDAWIMVSFNSSGGEHVWSGYGEGVLTMAHGFPRTIAVLEAPWPSGWLPVFVYRVRFAGIRWLPLRADATRGPRPEDVTEVKAEPALYVVE